MHIRLRRRRFGQIALVAALMTAVSDRFRTARGQSLSPQEATSMPTATIPLTTVTLAVNGVEQAIEIEPRVTLLDLLRERLGLTGSKKGCNHGQCGACTVLADGKRINSCLALAVQYEGAEITTIEGIADGDILHPMQTAFIDHEGFQCGFCTSGQICSAVALLGEVEAGDVSAVTGNIIDLDGPFELTDAEIRERMSGNLCRCGAYPGIVAAVNEVHGA
ncbi:MAG: 2Fe-2S iron-sulfur cluster-binding protein [Elainellaceae cyanobacterium]